MKKCYEIVAIGDGTITGRIMLTKKEAELVEKVIDSLGNYEEESYSPVVLFNEVKDEKR